MESCKKINGRVRTFRFSVFTMGRLELCAEYAKKTPKLEKGKRKLLIFWKRYDLQPFDKIPTAVSGGHIDFWASVFRPS